MLHNSKMYGLLENSQNTGNRVNKECLQNIPVEMEPLFF